MAGGQGRRAERRRRHAAAGGERRERVRGQCPAVALQPRVLVTPGRAIDGRRRGGRGRVWKRCGAVSRRKHRLVGAPYDDNDVGAAWLFADRPVVWTVSPSRGTAAGGTPVTITGTALGGTTAVRFGSQPAHPITVESSTQVSVIAPSDRAGTVDVTVTTPAGTSARIPADRFRYYGRPSIAHAALTGVARRAPRLVFTLAAARGAPPIRSLLLVPPSGLTYSASAPSLKAGVAIRSGGRRLRFTAKAAQGTLGIQLAKPAAVTSVTIASPAVRASASLARRVKRHAAGRLSFIVRSADASNAIVDLTLRLKPR